MLESYQKFVKELKRLLENNDNPSKEAIDSIIKASNLDKQFESNPILLKVIFEYIKKDMSSSFGQVHLNWVEKEIKEYATLCVVTKVSSFTKR